LTPLTRIAEETEATHGHVIEAAADCGAPHCGGLRQSLVPTSSSTRLLDNHHGCPRLSNLLYGRSVLGRIASWRDSWGVFHVDIFGIHVYLQTSSGK